MGKTEKKQNDKEKEREKRQKGKKRTFWLLKKGTVTDALVITNSSAVDVSFFPSFLLSFFLSFCFFVFVFCQYPEFLPECEKDAVLAEQKRKRQKQGHPYGCETDIVEAQLIVRCNPNFERLYGYTQSELRSLFIRDG